MGTPKGGIPVTARVQWTRSAIFIRRDPGGLRASVDITSGLDSRSENWSSYTGAIALCYHSSQANVSSMSISANRLGGGLVGLSGTDEGGTRERAQCGMVTMLPMAAGGHAGYGPELSCTSRLPLSCVGPLLPAPRHLIPLLDELGQVGDSGSGLAASCISGSARVSLPAAPRPSILFPRVWSERYF